MHYNPLSMILAPIIPRRHPSTIFTNRHQLKQ